MRNVPAAMRRTVMSRRATRLAVAAFCLTLVGGQGLTRATPAHAAGGDVIDVGFTILQNGYWKGSGSYSNPNGTFGHVCVRLYYDHDSGKSLSINTRCVATPKGSGFAFSAPDMQCSPSLDLTAYVFTEVTAYDHNANIFNGNLGNQITSKDSNFIFATGSPKSFATCVS